MSVTENVPRKESKYARKQRELAEGIRQPFQFVERGVPQAPEASPVSAAPVRVHTTTPQEKTNVLMTVVMRPAPSYQDRNILLRNKWTREIVVLSPEELGQSHLHKILMRGMEVRCEAATRPDRKTLWVTKILSIENA